MADIDDAELIDTPDRLGEIVAELVTEDVYALDTEFHRERTYFAQVALVQIAYADRLVLIDPLAVDLAALRPVMEGDATAVIHAPRQDLEVLERACGAAPSRVFDTQLAGGFLGYSTPSLASLLDRELGVRLPKADRLTDWLRRPLSDRQLRYAAADVADLLELRQKMQAQLDDRGRADWFAAATAEALDEPRGPRDPDDAWRKVKEIRHLKGRDLATAQILAAWRERRAQEMDLTPRFVLSDLGVVGLAVARPTSYEAIGDVRGVDNRSLRAVADELIQLIADSADATPTRDRHRGAAQLSPALRPALPLISAWITHLSRETEMEASLLATRADIEAFLRGDDDARLARGWRRELVGEPIRQLVDGEVAIAFEPSGGLRLEPRAASNANAD